MSTDFNERLAAFNREHGQWQIVDTSNSSKRSTPQVTLEALMFQLRAGVSAIKQDSALRRLSELTDEQFREAVTRLQKLHIAPAWSEGDLETLYAARSLSHAA